MRILFVLENYYPNIGGVETLFKALCEELVSEGLEVSVLTNRFEKDLKSTEVLNGVKIIRLNFYNRYLFTFLSGWHCYKHALKHDFIHTTSYNAALPAFFASVLSRKKILITFHEVWSNLWFRLPYMNKASLFLHFLFEKFILQLGFDLFVAVSDATQKSLESAGIKKHKIRRIYNGINYSEFDCKQREEDNALYQFCYFGRLGMSKGLNLIIDAVQLASEQNLKFKFLLIIPRTPRNFLKTILDDIEARQLNSYFEFRHELPFEELKNCICKSNAVVVPSYSEGFCYSAVEAMALGTPVIHSGQGALSEVVGGKQLKMQELSGASLFACMQMAMRNEWNNLDTREFKLRDSIDKYLELYKSLRL